MKKIFLVMLCVTLLASCGIRPTPPAPQTGVVPTDVPIAPPAVKTMIEPTKVKPISDDWTILGEVGVIIGGEYTDIILATDAKRGDDGYMMWDDSHSWRLVAIGEENCYSLFDKRISGTSYIDVTMEGEDAKIKLISTSTAGLSVTEYTYSEGAFYAEELIKPDSDGNRIYSSFPEYYE